jgi:hypothetical protein
MRITRRHLLALSAGTTAAAAVLAGSVATQWWNQAADAPFTVLENEEAAFVRAWAGAAFPATTTIPLAGHRADLDRFFDQMLFTMPAETGKLLRLLLHALNHTSVPTAGARFTSLPAPEQSRLFEAWTHTDLDPARSAAQSLVLLLGMGWSTHPEVAPHMKTLHSCGYGR